MSRWLLAAVLAALLTAFAAMFWMSQEQLKGYGTIWLAIDTVTITYFTVGYGFLARWYGDEVAVHLLLFSAAISVTFINLLYLRLAKGATAAPEGLTVVTGFYVVLAFLFTWRCVIFTHAQIDARREVRRGQRLDDRHAEGTPE